MFEVQSNSFRYFFKKSEKSEVEVTTGLFTRLVIDVCQSVRISDVTTASNSFNFFIVIFGTYFFCLFDNTKGLLKGTTAVHYRQAQCFRLHLTAPCVYAAFRSLDADIFFSFPLLCIIANIPLFLFWADYYSRSLLHQGRKPAF